MSRLWPGTGRSFGQGQAGHAAGWDRDAGGPHAFTPLNQVPRGRTLVAL